MESTRERRIALFIDFENLVTKTGIAADDFDLQPAIDRLLERGKVVFRRAYCDWSRFKEAKENLHRLGVELVDVPASTRAGKNAADMRLTIDAIELCYAREHIDTFVIASGDSDFVPLANKLRENDRIVIGLAVKEATSPHFVNACDEFIYMRGSDRPSRGRAEAREGHKDREREKEAERNRSGRGPKREPAKAGSNRGGGRGPAPVVPEFVSEVVEGLLSRATGPVNPSALKEAIVRKKPDFDERDHGFSTFTKILMAMEDAGLLRRQQSGRQWYVLPPEAASDRVADGGEGTDRAEPSPGHEGTASTAPGHEAAAPARPPRESTAPAREAGSSSGTAREVASPAREAAPPTRASTAPADAPTAPARDATAPAREATAPAREATAPAREATARAREATAPARGPAREPTAPARGPARESAPPAREPTGPGREVATPPRQTETPARAPAAAAATRPPAKPAPAREPSKAAAARETAKAARAAASREPAKAASARDAKPTREPAKAAAGRAPPKKAAGARKASPARRPASTVDEDAYEEEIPDPD